MGKEDEAWEHTLKRLLSWNPLCPWRLGLLASSSCLREVSPPTWLFHEGVLNTLFPSCTPGSLILACVYSQWSMCTELSPELPHIYAWGFPERLRKSDHRVFPCEFCPALLVTFLVTDPPTPLVTLLWSQESFRHPGRPVLPPGAKCFHGTSCLLCTRRPCLDVSFARVYFISTLKNPLCFLNIKKRYNSYVVYLL